MGRRRRKSPAQRAAINKRKADQQKKIGDMSYHEYEDFLKTEEGGQWKERQKIEEHGYGGRGGRRRADEAAAGKAAYEAGHGNRHSKEFKDFVSNWQSEHGYKNPDELMAMKRRSWEEGLMQPAAPGVDPAQQDPGVMSSTGAQPGSYMDRVRRERAKRGVPGYEQYAQQPGQPGQPGSPKGGGGRPPKGQGPDPRSTTPGYVDEAGNVVKGRPPGLQRPQSPKGGRSPKGQRPQGRPNPYAGGQNWMDEAGISRKDQMVGNYRPNPSSQGPRKRAYNPKTGLME